jgi:uncharacterized protein DUF5666
MIATRKTTPVLVLALSLLLTAAAALAATGAGRWSGTIASVSGDDLALVGVSEHFRLAGSVTELVSGRALSSTDLAPGSAVTLRIGSREADGRFRVDGAQVERKDALALEGEITSVAADGRSMEVLGVRVELDSHTAFAGAGRLVRSGADLRVGMMAKVSLTSTSVRSLQAAEVRIRSSNSRSTRVMSGRSESGEDQELKGTVEQVSDTSWTIGGQAFAIDDGTIFVGAPGLGDFVEVRFHLDSSGNPVADRIRKEDAAGDELEFRGLVEAIGASSWTVSGRVVGVNAQTVITGNPKLGDLVEVRANRAPDLTLTATSIQREDAANDEQEFRGVVSAIGASSWTIGGVVLLVDGSTVILGNPQIGDDVEVRANRAADGTLTATRIAAEDGGGGNDDPPGDDNGGGSGGGNDDPTGDNGGGSGQGGH